MYNTPDTLQRLRELEQLGWQHLYNDATREARQVFEQGIRFARQHEQSCWEILFEFYICQIYVYYTVDLQTAVDAAVRLVSRLHRPAMAQCWERTLSYGILVHAYFYRDCLGYESEIRDALHYIESELPTDREARLRIDYIRAELDLEHGRYQAVRQQLMTYLAQAEQSHPYRKADGCRLGHLLSYALGDFAAARDYAERNARHSQEGQHQRGIADALIWQAVYTLKLGDGGEAQRVLQQALDHYRRFKLAPALTYFDALCEYHTLNADFDRVLALREQQFLELPARGGLHELAKAHLQYCRLLGHLGRPLEESLAKADSFIRTLRKPETHLAALQRIAAGHYLQFAWQR